MLEEEEKKEEQEEELPIPEPVETTGETDIERAINEIRAKQAEFENRLSEIVAAIANKRTKGPDEEHWYYGKIRKE